MSESARRISSLDALRGVAAAAVVLSHFFAAIGYCGLMHPSVPLIGLLGRLPVATFFALSGYVLALPFFTGRAPITVVFLVKRIFRIYLPYIAVAAIAAVAFGIPTRAVAWGTLLMSGTPAGVWLNVPFWSLVVEMRFSLLFPVLVAFVLRWPRGAAIAAIGTALGAYAMVPWVAVNPPIYSPTVVGSFVVTAYYTPLFIGGILLARYRKNVASLARGHEPTLWCIVALLVAIGFVNDLAFLIAPLGVVALVPRTPALIAAFKWHPIVWLGRVSYSLYLIHYVILWIIWRHWHNGLLAAALFIPISLILAEVCYRLFEVPSIRLGATFAAGSGYYRVASTLES